jgi:hypothetical protein
MDHGPTTVVDTTRLLGKSHSYAAGKQIASWPDKTKCEGVPIIPKIIKCQRLSEYSEFMPVENLN